MNAMVERVATAIYETHLAGDVYATRWQDLRDKQKDGFRDNARAAIAAMREPTEAMRAAGIAGTKGSYDSFTYGAYELMVDEALKD